MIRITADPVIRITAELELGKRSLKHKGIDYSMLQHRVINCVLSVHGVMILLSVCIINGIPCMYIPSHITTALSDSEIVCTSP